MRVGMRGICITLVCLSTLASAVAQHGIDVQRLTADGQYYKALTAFQALPDRIVNDEVRASVAESAWALSLPGKAAYEFDKILRSDKELSPQRRARILLSRGIIEYQEGRYQEAVLFGEKALSNLTEASALRSRAYMLLGQAYKALKSYGQSEEKLIKALAETADEDRGEIVYQLGTIQMLLGKFEEADKHLREVPLEHDRAPQSIKTLAQIAFDSAKFTEVAFWLEKGRGEYPAQFLDSWVDYALIKSATESGAEEKANDILKEAVDRYPPSDTWIVAAEALVEATNWKELRAGTR